MTTQRRGAVAPVAAALALMLPGIAAAQVVDCDRYPRGSAAWNSCFQHETWRAHEELQHAYEHQQAVDRYTREQRYDGQRDRADPATRWHYNDGGSSHRSDDDDDDR